MAIAIIGIGWVLPFIHIPDQWVRYANIVRCFKLFVLLRSFSSDYAFVYDALYAIFRGSTNVVSQLYVWTGLFVAAVSPEGLSNSPPKRFFGRRRP